MFTGIVEELGEVVGIEESTTSASGMGSGGTGGGRIRRLRLRADTVTADLKPGGSIAVDGACLTAAEVSEGQVVTDVVSETLNRTSLGGLTVGSRVNLERPAILGARMDGHLVQGHVDGVGRIGHHDADGSMRIELPPGLSRYVVEKGSIAVDGISLTVVEAGDTSFTIALIPTTLAITTLGRKDVGDLVNLEVDVLAKYLERLTGAAR